MTEEIKKLCDTIQKLTELNLELTRMLTGLTQRTGNESQDREVLSSNPVLTPGRVSWNTVKRTLEERYKKAEREPVHSDPEVDWDAEAEKAVSYVQGHSAREAIGEDTE